MNIALFFGYVGSTLLLTAILLTAARFFQPALVTPGTLSATVGLAFLGLLVFVLSRKH